MRGKDLYSVPFRDELRITPAYAGKSHIRSSLNAVSGDHPRVCGEKISFFFTGCSPRGSPPRMRGKVDLSLKVVCVLGITPAYAGKSRCNLPSTAPWKDHPRVCGEKHAVPVSLMWSAGSPPRVRGKGLLEVFVPEPLRITPAYAGKSAAQSLDRLCAGDHPRVCGEKFNFFAKENPPQGSPPRVRGKVGQLENHQMVVGITPACAGKSCPDGYTPCPARDHPRVCGEKSPAAV